MVKSGKRICGTGACLGNAPIHQNKAYFEVKIQSTGERYAITHTRIRTCVDDTLLFFGYQLTTLTQ